MECLDVSREDLSELDGIVTEDEVWKAIRSLPADKASGTDGFTAQFYQIAWDIIKGDMIAAVQQFFYGDNRSFELLNEVLITLLPKREDAVEIGDFRPISLLHNFVKIVAKILAIRLSKKLGCLVGRNQSAFVSGRCIQDNFALVQQSLKILHRKKVSSLFLKLDVAKAFDSLSWPFLLEVLVQDGDAGSLRFSRRHRLKF